MYLCTVCVCIMISLFLYVIAGKAVSCMRVYPVVNLLSVKQNVLKVKTIAGPAETFTSIRTRAKNQ